MSSFLAATAAPFATEIPPRACLLLGLLRFCNYLFQRNPLFRFRLTIKTWPGASLLLSGDSRCRDRHCGALWAAGLLNRRLELMRQGLHDARTKAGMRRLAALFPGC